MHRGKGGRTHKFIQTHTHKCPSNKLQPARTQFSAPFTMAEVLCDTCFITHRDVDINAAKVKLCNQAVPNNTLLRNI